MASFEVGDKVLFCHGDSLAWFEGKVEGRTRDGSYRVRKLPGDEATNNSIVYTASDIRVMPQETSMQDKMMEAMMEIPEPYDPNSHLYMAREDVIEQDPHAFDNLDGVEEAEARPDGSHRLRLRGGRGVDTATLSMPEDMYGVDGQTWMMFATFVSNRRKCSGASGIPDVKNIVRSTLPSERNLDDLKEAAQHDPAKMLQLGDATYVGLYGWPRDRSQAVSHYMCAAWGCSETNVRVSDVDAYPMGPPEALCAAASAFYELMSDQFGGANFHQVIQAVRNDPQLMGAMHRILLFLGHAIRRDWVCPFALALGQALRDEQLLDPFIPHTLHILNALECRNEVMKKPSDMTGRPSRDTMRLFEPKATEIFLGMPAPTMTPSGQVRNDWHIEYREMPFPPYPIVVLVINPPSRFIRFVNISEDLEYCPYSKEAFKQIWARIVFDFHLGDGRGRNRQRPAILTLVNKPGDAAFAEFIREQLGENSGTEIRMVTHDYSVIGVRNRRERLGDIVDETEQGIIRGMKRIMKWDPNDIRTPIEQMNTPFQNRHNMNTEDVLARASELKEEGNDYYTRGRMLPAKKSYSEAIDLIRASTNQDNETYKLLGTLLSNRSACFMKMVETMNPETAVSVLKTAITDCQIALESSWSGAVLPHIRQKLQQRREALVELSARLAGRIHRMEDDILNAPDALDAEDNDISTSQQPSVARRHPRRRRAQTRGQRQRQRQNRRRRLRQAERSQQDEAENASTSENEPENQNEDEKVNLQPGMFVQMGKDLLETNIASNVSEQDDVCPCCTERFRVELEDKHAVVLSCSHACCVPCLASLKRASERQRNALPFTCPICRFGIQEDCLEQIARFVVADTDAIQHRLKYMPLSSGERADVAQRLLFHHSFVVAKVLASLDSMMVDSLQSGLWRLEDLSPEEKKAIYEEARRPVDALREELRHLESRLQQIRDQESEDYIQLLRRVRELQQQIVVANKNAQDEIYSRINSTSNMGRVSESGEVQIDFHALHVDEAKTKFDELVFPILPAIGRLLLIVGRGRHSEGGVAKLKPSLKSHIENHPKRRWIRWEDVRNNAGALRVVWKGK